MPLKTILIVDDDRNLRQSMALILRRDDYQVDTAGSAAEALSNLERAKYDLAICDMMMPDDSSILLPRILTLYPCLPILVLTVQKSPETELEGQHKGRHVRLVKPVTPETLLEWVKSILETKPCAAGGELFKQVLN
jgi:DNA-binding response OmpR family regulator